MKKTITVKELSQIFSEMADKYPNEISKFVITFDNGLMEFKLFPVKWTESINVDFKVEKSPDDIEIPNILEQPTQPTA
jgi:hypothetical protein